MTNSYLRGATAALFLTATCSPLYPGLRTAFAGEVAGGATIAMVLPAAAQIDAFGYAGSALTSVSDTGSLLKSTHSAGTPYFIPNSVADSPTTSQPTAVAGSSMMSPLAALELLDPNAPENKSLKALYQLERLTTPAQPHLSATFFGGGLAAEDYFLTDEGIQLEQSITEGIGIVGRATGYQLWIEKNATSPLSPSNRAVNRLNFGRFEGGLDFS